MFIKNAMLTLQNSDAQTRVPHTRIWPFLQGVLKRFPRKMQMNQQIIDSDKLNKIYFNQYSRNEQIYFSAFLRGHVLRWVEVFTFPNCEQAELCNKRFRVSAAS